LPRTGIAAGAAPGSPLAFLLRIVADETAEPELRVRCAIAALPYCHPRAPDAAGGKKAAVEAAARDAERGTEWERLLAV
jgi:hypothetical protein